MDLFTLYENIGHFYSEKVTSSDDEFPGGSTHEDNNIQVNRSWWWTGVRAVLMALIWCMN